MSEEIKGPRKKSDEEKKEEKDAMVNLWMSNLGAEEENKENDETSLKTEEKP